jgi:hypothetical protein
MELAFPTRWPLQPRLDLDNVLHQRPQPGGGRRLDLDQFPSQRGFFPMGLIQRLLHLLVLRIIEGKISGANGVGKL